MVGQGLGVREAASWGGLDPLPFHFCSVKSTSTSQQSVTHHNSHTEDSEASRAWKMRTLAGPISPSLPGPHPG